MVAGPDLLDVGERGVPMAVLEGAGDDQVRRPEEEDGDINEERHRAQVVEGALGSSALAPPSLREGPETGGGGAAPGLGKTLRLGSGSYYRFGHWAWTSACPLDSWLWVSCTGVPTTFGSAASAFLSMVPLLVIHC